MRASTRSWAIVALLGALLAAELTREVVTRSGLVQGDLAVTTWIAAHRTGWLTFLASTLTWLGSSFVIIPVGVAVGALLWFRRREWIPMAMLAAAFLGAAGIYDIVKPTVGRARPAPHLQVGGPDDGYAFPSGHATQSAAFYAMLAIVLVISWFPHRRLQLAGAAGLLVVVIGATRLYLGVHWLTDVLGGVAFGMTWLAVVMLVAPMLRRRRS